MLTQHAATTKFNVLLIHRSQKFTRLSVRKHRLIYSTFFLQSLLLNFDR